MTRLQPAILVAASAERTATACRAVPKRWNDEHICSPRVVRSYSTVCTPLRDCFRQLCTGKLPWPLYLHGGVGIGKTRAALALCDKVGFARFWPLDDVVRSMFARDAPWQRLWGLPDGPRLAVLDEIGLHDEAKDWEYDALKMFADWREDQPAIYISNHPVEKLKELYDQRIESRLSCGTVFELTGSDRRLRS